MSEWQAAWTRLIQDVPLILEAADDVSVAALSMAVMASGAFRTFKTTPLPEGQMLDFGDSNVVKIRADNGATTYRFYAGKRHVDNLWIEGASKICAP